MPVVRYRDQTTFAQFWLYDNATTWYREFRSPAVPPGWQWPMGTLNVGANNICDDKWHDWKIVVKGADNTLYIDGKLIGSCKSIPEKHASVQSRHREPQAGAGWARKR